MAMIGPLKSLAAAKRPITLKQRIGAILSGVSSPQPLKGLLYSIYGARLQARLLAGPLPRHIGVVLDGNRRYAEVLGHAHADAYRIGTEKIDSLLTWCDELEIPVVILWSLSLDNMQRDLGEVEGLLQIVEEKLPKLQELQSILRHPRQIRVPGRLELLAPSLQREIQRVERATSSNSGFYLNIALGYGGREEIVDAVKDLIREECARGSSTQEIIDRITPKGIGSHLYFSGVPDPDLIIRTSGEIRLSGFLLWGSVYSEYYFCDALWPAFRKVDFLRAIRSYQGRKRRFGA
ncbi:MAG: undecaprenyl diphosphate synthase [Dehalococcoidia bacterium]|nr:undecaprenyl diphosphate synthase [Dehalococcoidia bacterium]